LRGLAADLYDKRLQALKTTPNVIENEKNYRADISIATSFWPAQIIILK
jgi:hypothetical protein